ncbi:MAG: FtsX-like permease family protein [Acidobacteria bacterium]|nr:FtsX-like permease family protein [Acidobacteriota bacterium]
MADVITVTPGFFAAMRTDIVHGRSFEALDSNEPLVVIVNQQFADRFWGADQAVGKWIATNPERPMTVIGVSETVRHYGPAAETRPAVFYPYQGRPHRALFGVVGVAEGADPMALADSVRRTVRELDSQVAVSNIDSMRGRFRDSLAQQQVIMWLLNFFGVTAITLATVGLFGVLSFAVANQTREVGIRKALGAQRRHLYQLVLRGAAVVTLAGLILGTGAALATARSIQSAVFGAAQVDALAILVAASLVLVTAAGASFIPARRATRIDPMVALKQD